MGRTKKMLLASILCITLTAIPGCAKDKMSDDPQEILSMAYKNMSEVEAFSARSTLDGELKYLKWTNDINVVSDVAQKSDPYELMVKTTVDTSEEPAKTSYLYSYEQEDQLLLYSYKENNLRSVNVDMDRVEELKEQYIYPVSFGTYLINIDSFTLASEEDGTVILEGTVLKEKIVSALKESGILKQFALTNFPEDELADDLTIPVKVWVERENMTITKLEVDMKDAVQAVTTLIFGEDSVTSPEIMRCILTVDNIQLGNADAVSLPKEAADSLDQIKNQGLSAND